MFLGAASCALVTLVCSSSSADTLPPTSPPPPAPHETGAIHGNTPIGVGVLGGVGFPRPLAVEGVLKLDRLVLFGVEYSALPAMSVSGGQLSLWALAGDLRVFPLRNGFFIGLRAGKQHLGELASVSVSGVGSVSATQGVDTIFVNPRVGFLWSWHALAFGLDAGVQVPVSSTTSSSLPAGVSAPSSATDLAHTFGQSALPTIDLLRIGVVL
jgi:hypothetical protein